MISFSDWNNKKEKKTDYEIVKSRSGLPMFILPPPDLPTDEKPVKKNVITSQSIITNKQRNKNK